MVIPRFVKAALLGEPLLVYGDGGQQRCFGYVQDVIDGLMALVNDSRSWGNVFNIGSTQEITIEQLARLIIQKTQSSSEIRFVPYEEVYGPGFDDMFRRKPCLEKIETLVGYKPHTTLDATLDVIIDHIRKEIVAQKEPLPLANATD